MACHGLLCYTVRIGRPSIHDCWVFCIIYVEYVISKPTLSFCLVNVSFHSAEEPSDNETPHTEAPTICQTPECVSAASEILRNLDPKYADIDPCTDFDQYVCGGWRENHDMRSDQGAIFSGTFMQEASQARLRHLLETSSPSDPADSDIFDKLKSGYNACLDEDRAKKRGNEPLEKLLQDFEKIYSMDSGSEGSETSLTDAVLHLIKSGVRALVESSVGVSYSINHDSLVLKLTSRYSLTTVTRIMLYFL